MGPAPRAGCVVTARPSASGSSDLIGLVAVHGIACGALALARSQSRRNPDRAITRAELLERRDLGSALLDRSHGRRIQDYNT